MEVLKNLVRLLIKFVRYLTLNILVGGLLDRLVFGPIERAVLGVLEGGGGSVEEQVWVGGGPGESAGHSVSGDGRPYNGEYGRGGGLV